MGRGGGGVGRGGYYGQGRGIGYGRGRWDDVPAVGDYRQIPVYREPSPEDEKAYLEGFVKDLEADLKEVKARLGELAKKEK